MIDRHVFMWQPLEILNAFTTLSLKLIFWKTKPFYKKLEYRFFVESTKIKCAIFPHNPPWQRPMLRQIECEIQIRPITKNGVFASKYFIFLKKKFSLRSSSKELIRCTTYRNAHIHTFRKRWSFIWRCFLPVSILINYWIYLNPNKHLPV